MMSSDELNDNALTEDELDASRTWRAQKREFLSFLPDSLMFFLSSQKEKEQAWLDYYEGLYQNHGPSSKKFKKNLNRYGFWDFRTPFKEGSSEYYKFHDENIFLSDINFLLERWQDKFAPQAKATPQNKTNDLLLPATERLIEDIQKGWVGLYAHQPENNPFRSIEETEREGILAHDKKESDWNEESAKCMGDLFLSKIKNWMWIKNYLHKDNLQLLIHVVLSQESDIEKKSRIINNLSSALFLTSGEKKWAEEKFLKNI